MNDREALFAIQTLLDGVEWTTNTLDEIARVMVLTGYRIRDLDDKDREPEEEVLK